MLTAGARIPDSGTASARLPQPSRLTVGARAAATDVDLRRTASVTMDE